MGDDDDVDGLDDDGADDVDDDLDDCDDDFGGPDHDVADDTVTVAQGSPTDEIMAAEFTGNEDSHIDRRSLTVAALKAELKSLGLKVSGNKEELVRRLEAAGTSPIPAD